MSNWRSLWSFLGWGMVLAVSLFSLTPNPPQADIAAWDKLNHLFAYGVLMYWFAQLHDRRLPVAAALFALGGALELTQGLTAYRQASWLDMLANGLGLGTGWLAALRLPNPLQWFEARRG
jgi:hypothetical protein